MLNSRSAGITMIILAVVCLLLMIVEIRVGWLLAAFFAVFVYLLVMGSVKVCSGFYVDVFCRGASTENSVALTFDDGPDAAFTPRILEILAKHHVPATFFVIGNKAENHPELLREMAAQGHSVGNHSYSHAFFFDLFGKKKMEQDLQQTEDIIAGITGRKPTLFRPPYGVTNPILAKAVKKMGYRAVGWSVRSLDTVLKDKEKLAERVIERLHPGAVILLHDDREITGMVLEDIILKIKEAGYRIVGVEELILKMEG